ncbi:Nif3-like dinuclear metal center hexameric protein [Pseudidiomarina sp. WS423]|uniref:Nif3-like dinuclear metal center hexameric protein n=1 Tax=Pseudidiomarina sp. WS423 TaxID=3425124 RepID=UPI003D6F7EC8
MQRYQLQQYLAELLQVDTIKDYCPNGLQVEGRAEIKTLVTGVTANQALLDQALALNADAVLVHHGYFWKNEPEVITGMKKRRLQSLLQADVNLFAYHLPLDVHATLGNNAQLAQVLGWQDSYQVAGISPAGVVMGCDLTAPLSSVALAEHLSEALQRPVTACIERAAPIQRVAWCTGGGQGFIDAVAAAGFDAFISGEISEQTTHSAREQGLAYIAAGHHATERYGVQALGKHLAAQFGLRHHFIDIDNPA